MNKKLLIGLADALKRAKPDRAGKAVVQQWERDVNEVADFCAESNPAFKRDRFFAYIRGECGTNGGKVK